MTSPKAILIGSALIAASILITEAVSPAEAQGQTGIKNPKVAKCVLDNLDKAHSDQGANALIRACMTLNER